jgi:hypothetical protein
MTLRQLSITGAGIISAILILLPGTAALFFSQQALEEVRTVQKREPLAFADLVTEPSQLGEPAAWNDVAAALADRIPLRVHLTRLLRGVERDLLGRRRFDKVIVCPGPWLYYAQSLDRVPVTAQRLEQAMDALRAQVDDGRRRFYLAPPPDKVSIYPEFLCSHRLVYERNRARRDTLHEHFAASRSPELIDTWTPMLNAKASSPEPLYFQTDTHYTARGAAIYAKTLIDGISPGLWGEPRVSVGPPSLQRRDLTELAGLPGPTENSHELTVERSGVRLDACRVESVPIDCKDVFSEGGRSARIHVVSDGTTVLIPGRTLIIHDSFIEGFLKPVLWQYFEDVSFIHFNQLEPGDLAASLAAYDRIIVSRVERQLGQVVSQMRKPIADMDLGRRLGLDFQPWGEAWTTNSPAMRADLRRSGAPEPEG